MYWVKNRKKPYQEIFFANNVTPYFCEFCSDQVDVKVDFCIHHLDGNRRNNEVDNIAIAHHGCHTRYHKTGQKHSEETKAKISQSKLGMPVPSLQGKKLSKEHKAKLSASHLGNRPTEETRRKMRISQSNRRSREVL